LSFPSSLLSERLFCSISKRIHEQSLFSTARRRSEIHYWPCYWWGQNANDFPKLITRRGEDLAGAGSQNGDRNSARVGVAGQRELAITSISCKWPFAVRVLLPARVSDGKEEILSRAGEDYVFVRFAGGQNCGQGAARRQEVGRRGRRPLSFSPCLRVSLNAATMGRGRGRASERHSYCINDFPVRLLFPPSF